jgi:hypothetical protein
MIMPTASMILANTSAASANEVRTLPGVGKDAGQDERLSDLGGHRHHANLARIASPLRADIIFGKNTSLWSPDAKSSIVVTLVPG